MTEQHSGRRRPVERCGQQAGGRPICIERAARIEDKPGTAGRDDFDAGAADRLRTPVNDDLEAQGRCSPTGAGPVRMGPPSAGRGVSGAAPYSCTRI